LILMNAFQKPFRKKNLQPAETVAASTFHHPRIFSDLLNFADKRISADDVIESLHHFPYAYL